MQPANYFALEGAILERLHAHFDTEPSLRHVAIDAAPDMEAAADGAIAPPAVFLVPGGDRVTEQAARGRTHQVAQQWLVIVVTRDVASATGAAARAEAGAIVSAVLGALAGWQPAPADGPAALYAPLARANAGAPEFFAGLFFYPVAFDCRFSVQL